MSKKLEITIKIIDETGETLVSETSERAVPYIEEIENKGFRSAFHELETAVLELRKEASDEIVSKYLELVSEKKREKKGKKSREKDME